ncbi:hypothetical protein AAFC00_002279 [Neodothiora populina]|uniref:Uncharacterized protein n=1 Tax=Neodothiora populina TaxID=2781224 RepID=A0ABR3PGW9_9PEZI
MATTTGDYQLAAAAAGFTLGFGFLTVWKAIKQTRQNKSPLRSVYVYMLWGEILSNLIIGILGWLFLHEVLGATAIVLFWILFCYVFEVQLLLQIIINRIAIFTERRSTATYMKWGTAIFITCVNIVVFCIWIPAHMVPPPSAKLVHINVYWDRVSKVLILLVDAGLNWYFVHVVSTRLVKHNGLKKYKSLIRYYTRLGVISVCMDIMLIGLMSLRNQVVYIQFHPVAYMVKLNIEMSMADLIVKIARSSEIDVHDMSSGPKGLPDTNTIGGSKVPPGMHSGVHDYGPGQASTFKAAHAPISAQDQADRDDVKGITRQREVQVYIQDSDGDSLKMDNPKKMSRDDGHDLTLERHPSRTSNGSQIPLKDMHPHSSYA